LQSVSQVGAPGQLVDGVEIVVEELKSDDQTDNTRSFTTGYEHREKCRCLGVQPLNGQLVKCLFT
jgi:hypothetical protein